MSRKATVISVLAALVAASISLTAQTPLRGRILKIDFDTPVAERGGSGLSVGLGGISSASTFSLLTMERVIDAAAKDDKVAMIFLKTDKYSCSGLAASEEIRRSLERFKASGKPVVAYATGFDATRYYLASVADQVVMNPAGEGELVGMSSTLFFYKDLLDKLGVKVQLIRHGKYKSAGEPFIRNDISDDNREQYQAMLGSIWEARMAEIAASRGLSPETIEGWVESLALDRADSWLETGLVDRLCHKGEMEEYLCKRFGVKEPGLLSVVSVGDYASKLKKGPSKAKVAVIYANGSIGSGSDIDGVKMAAAIAQARADSTVKAIVWRVNSPGGEVVASDLIRREIDEARKVKPVIASYGSYAASGGYWISSSSDRIFTDNATLTGSIGVFGMVPALGEAIQKNLKVNPVSVGTHSHSDMMSGIREFSDEERSWMQDNIDHIYERFVSLVAESRGLDKEFVDGIAQGRVWSGVNALTLGLADERGTVLDAVEYAAAKAGLEKYRIICRPEVKSMSLRNMLRGTKDDDDPLVSVELPQAVTPLASALQDAGALVGDLSRPTVQARLPYVVDIR